MTTIPSTPDPNASTATFAAEHSGATHASPAEGAPHGAPQTQEGAIASDATPEPAPHPTAPDVNPPGMDPLPPELSPPASIAAYELPPPADESPEAFAADVEARSWLLAAGMPAAIGSFLGQEIGRMQQCGHDIAGGSDAEFELGRASLMAKLETMYGAEATQKKLADVQWLVEHVDRKSGGRLGDWLEQNAGVLLNVAVVGQLAVHAERMRGRLR